jgi:WXG100 family type VII secretion target
MPSPKVRADYQQLSSNAAAFGRQADLARQSLQNVRKQQGVLRDGDWIGLGASQFYAEMDGQVLPTLNRLVLALEAANSATLQISQIIKTAEEEAARVLHGEGAAGSNGATGEAGRAVAGGQVTGRGQSIFERALKPMDPLAMLRQIDDMRQMIKTPTTIVSIARALNQMAQFAGRDGFSLLSNPLLRTVSRSFSVYDIGRNSISLVKNIQDGNLDAVQNVGDIVAGGAGLIRHPVTLAFAAGYKAGQLIDKYTGVSSYLADKMVDFFAEPQTYSTRTLMQEYVNKHATPAEKTAYADWRRDYNAQGTAAQQAGQPMPPFKPPDLQVFRKMDPAILKMAQSNKEIPEVFYNMAVRNQEIPAFVKTLYFK